MKTLFRSRRVTIAAVVMAVVLLAVCLALSPVFELTTVEITGNHKLSAEEIKKIAELDRAKNTIVFNAGAAKKNLKRNPYVEKVEIQKQFPSRIVVKLEERRLSGYVEYIGGFLYIDENGLALEAQPYFTEPLPVVVGLQFDRFNLGQKLEVDNPKVFDAVVSLAKLFNKYEMEDEVIRVDVSDVEDIHLYIYNVDVLFGGIADADEKVRKVRASLEKLPSAETVKGFLDVQNIDANPRFRLLR